jgi:hypothetical protein
MGRECSMHGEKRNAYRILVRKPEGKIRLWRHRRKWEDKFDLREIGWARFTCLRIETHGGRL